MKFCVICVERAYSHPEEATTTESDEQGNELEVCADHAEELASKTPERAADVWYDEHKDI